MEQNTNWVALGFVAVGTLFSFGRNVIARLFVRLHARISKRPADPRLEAGVKLYLVLMAMVFTVAGVLGLLKIISW